MTLGFPADRAQKLRDALPGNIHLIGIDDSDRRRMVIDYYYSDSSPEAQTRSMQAIETALKLHRIPGKLVIDYYYLGWTPDEAKAHGVQAAKALEFHMLSDEYGDVLVYPRENYEDGEIFNDGHLFVISDDNRAIRETLLLAGVDHVFDLPSLQENRAVDEHGGLGL